MGISIMSFTVSVSGYNSCLATSYSPALQLDGQYECGLLYIATFNSIPNVDHRNNNFYYGNGDHIQIPTGSYELQDICDYLKQNVKDCTFNLTCNNNTLQTSILCSKDILFSPENSIGSTLGFGKGTIKANILSHSQYPVNILSTSVLRVECDIVCGSFVNGKSSHIIHEFVPNVPPGYRIIEVPKNVIYFPVNQHTISSISIRILDVNNNLVNLRGEEILLYLHIKKKQC